MDKTHMEKIKTLLPGIMVATTVGMAALFLSEHYGAPAMLFALLLGIAMSFLHQGTQCKSGIEFTASTILRIGVALLGLRIAFGDLIALGWKTGLLLVVAIMSTILLGVVLAKAFGLQKRFGVLTGGAVGICGASAAMAISAVLPDSKDKDRDTLLTIIGVTALSTMAMVVYPIIAGMLELDETATSIFLGGTIHDVAQVVGAGYSVSEQTGVLATLTKLVRVALLMPVVVCILLVLRMKMDKTSHAKAPGIPLFLIGFVILMSINSMIALPEVLTKVSADISRFALVIAIAAIG
ncbi:MAG: putative sulfate exporter family transporter, partial [Paraglaciecola polaris]